MLYIEIDREEIEEEGRMRRREGGELGSNT